MQTQAWEQLIDMYFLLVNLANVLIYQTGNLEIKLVIFISKQESAKYLLTLWREVREYSGTFQIPITKYDTDL